MKRALLAATALLSASVSPLSMSTAYAVPAPAADPATPNEQAICNADYVDNQWDPSAWRATVTGASSSATTPVPVTGSEENVNYRPDTGSTFVYAGFTNTTNPLVRTGGSPNMWGMMVFNDKIWNNTLYDVQMDFNHSVTYNWTCHVEQYVNHPTFVPDPPAPPPSNGNNGNGGTCTNNGNGGNNGNNNNNNQQNNGNGNGNNGCGNGNGGSGLGSSSNDNSGNGNGGGNNGCGLGNGGSNGTKDCDDNGNPGHYVDHYTWDPAGDYSETVTNNNIDDGTDITQSGLQQLGHVDGVTYDVYGTYTPGYRLLSCISPGKKGGTWTAKAYYTGGQCNTTVFNAAPTTSGTTFDSPPTASIPGL